MVVASATTNAGLPPGVFYLHAPCGCVEPNTVVTLGGWLARVVRSHVSTRLALPGLLVGLATCQVAHWELVRQPTECANRSVVGFVSSLVASISRRRFWQPSGLVVGFVVLDSLGWGVSYACGVEMACLGAAVLIAVRCPARLAGTDTPKPGWTNRTHDEEGSNGTNHDESADVYSG